MSKPTIVISVYRGVMQDVIASDPSVEAIVVDWDTDGSESGCVTVFDRFDRPNAANVSRCRVEPFSAIANTPVEEILKQSNILPSAST